MKADSISLMIVKRRDACAGLLDPKADVVEPVELISGSLAAGVDLDSNIVAKSCADINFLIVQSCLSLQRTGERCESITVVKMCRPPPS